MRIVCSRDMSSTLMALGARRRRSSSADEDEFEATEDMLESLRAVADEAGMVIEGRGGDSVMRLVVTTLSPQETPASPLYPPCVHLWDCLRNRTHNRGRGKYKCYLCRHCGAFQRR